MKSKAQKEEDFKSGKIQFFMLHYSVGVGLNLTVATRILALDVPYVSKCDFFQCLTFKIMFNIKHLLEPADEVKLNP